MFWRESETSKLAKAIAASLRREPDRWRKDRDFLREDGLRFRLSISGLSTSVYVTHGEQEDVWLPNGQRIIDACLWWWRWERRRKAAHILQTMCPDKAGDE
jgi:hypothetical protein